MPAPFQAAADALVSVMEQVAEGTIGSFDAAAAIRPILATLAPDHWEQLLQVNQVLGRVDGLLLTDGDPANSLGTIGSTAVDMAAQLFYPPKTSEGWPAPVPFVGADGPAGEIVSVSTTLIGLEDEPAVVAGGTPEARTLEFRLHDTAAVVQSAMEQVIYPLTDFAVPHTPAVIAAVVNPLERTAAFSGWGMACEKPVSISFNAIMVMRTQRGSATAPADYWREVRGYVLTDPTDAADGSGALVAQGSVLVDEQASVLSGVIIPLGGTITEADLDDDVFYGFQAFAADGSTAVAGETIGTLTGLARRASYYITGGNGATDAWDVTSDFDFAIALVTIEGGSVVDIITPEHAFRREVDAPSSILRRPAPGQPIMTPRMYVMQGYDTAIYDWGLTSGRAARHFKYIGGAGLGRWMPDRWAWTFDIGLTPAGLPLRIEARDLDHNALQGYVETAVYGVSPVDAAGRALTGLVQGDSTIFSGFPTGRLLTHNAGSGHANANASGVQTTLIGTDGAGANKYEGQNGATLEWYFENPASPFVEDAGDKYSAAYYLASTGQAAPDWWLAHDGINTVFAADSDAVANSLMDAWLDRMDRIIGRIADAAVGSWKEANANIVTLIATPITPAREGDGWGDVYSINYDPGQYKRNIAIASDRIVEHFRNAEADKVFLVPWHVAVDPINGYDGASDWIHPTVEGAEPMGDMVYFAVSVLVDEGVFD